MKLSQIECSIHSQNGEDGILSHLIERLHFCAKTFVEIGSGNGKENNTTYLVENGWSGYVYDAKAKRIEDYLARGYSKVQAQCMLVNPLNAAEIARTVNRDVDVLSLDIDSWDYQVLESLLINGMLPRIAVVEYNATFGNRAVSVPYPMRLKLKDIYYGAGVRAFEKLMTRLGYEFVTVDSQGVNAFFLLAGEGSHEIDDSIDWTDNVAMTEKFGDWQRRSKLIQAYPLQEV